MPAMLLSAADTKTARILRAVFFVLQGILDIKKDRTAVRSFFSFDSNQP